MPTKFIVAVITAEPAHIDVVGNALRSAVAAVRAEPGCIQYDLHRDQSHPGKFVMIEQWRDALALKTHSEASAFRGLSKVLHGRAILEVADLEKIA
ncbi:MULTISPECIES: putative quinol monooxygenase [Xanthomonas]|uniref:putative quinol monooxygenase n=1 Tax=Xanthomonas TaxID=338 RepID=UPI0005283736|nr:MULTISPECIES: putative quinol monooxygenase [Xanthomonas]MBE0315026.1 antibiotic biosynthesis monooxygenase [Xanthomonas citri pv. punicae]MDS0761460.1 antibiotic biosynthesis monooxygenase [Xanthomonas citri pv. punicae]MDS0765239.1 antibiotic biosynthesis monooxygenase [Xanthomonas citri pv. punicae]MDS0800002.1 antibiotic biosynthesis monooxygenase [Xanthomonas citri pv. punicae]MDS0832649.1 antibiotic biosynthesis monooxygenase [Xanthomonas citri pv. punicae]